jgi:hypothetical protein
VLGVSAEGQREKGLRESESQVVGPAFHSYSLSSLREIFVRTMSKAVSKRTTRECFTSGLGFSTRVSLTRCDNVFGDLQVERFELPRLHSYMTLT